jgi:adenylate cyclase
MVLAHMLCSSMLAPHLERRVPAERSRDRLDSWKEIAAYLGRNIRTVQLWEKYEGLPVFRQSHKKQFSIYSDRTVLDEWLVKRSTADNLPEQLRIAVLPFDTCADDSFAARFSAGLTEEVIAQLGQRKPSEMAAIPYSAACRTNAPDITLRKIGREAKARFLLKGSVRRVGKRVRIIVQLLRIKGPRLLWSNIYDRYLANRRDCLVAQIEVATHISNSMPDVGDRLAQVIPHSTAAHEAYLVGRCHLNKRTGEGFRRAVACFEKAIRIDRNYPLAYAGIADALLLSGFYTYEAPQAIRARAKETADLALYLDGGLSEVHSTNGELAIYRGSRQDAEAEFRLSITLNPKNPLAHCWYSNCLSIMGRHYEAMAEMQIALATDPASPLMHYQAGMVFYCAGQFDKAVHAFVAGLDLDSYFPLLHWGLGKVLERKARYIESIRELQKAAKLSFYNRAIVADLAYAMARAGNIKAATRHANQLMLASENRYVCPYHLARVYAELGRVSRALELLEKARMEGSLWLHHLAVDPQMEKLRSSVMSHK